ncbi:MAG: hypothetical protein U0637_13550 [Phycisphaerales bacterium]
MPDQRGDATGAWAAVFSSLLDEQWALLKSLDEMSRRQRAVIMGDEPEALLGLMDDRQQLIDRLETLTVRLQPMQTRWDEGQRGLSAGMRLQIEGRLRELAALAREVAARDAEDQALLVRRKQEIAAELASAAGGRRAMHAYSGRVGQAGGGDQSGGAVFQDREA